MILKKPEDMNRLFAEAFNAGDVKSVLALYEHEATPVLETARVAMNIEAIREALQRFIALMGKGKMTMENTYSIQAGDVALCERSGICTVLAPIAISSSWRAIPRRSSDANRMETGSILSIILLSPIEP